MALSSLFAHGWPGIMLLTILGLVIGSFLNVVAHRLPIMLARDWKRQAREQLDIEETGEAAPAREAPFNLFAPRSHCRSCGYQLRAVENIPIVSWLALHGRCANCGAAISGRYPLVEAITAVALLAAVASFGWSWLAVAAGVYGCCLIALACIDFDTHLLPDQMTLPLLWAGLTANAIGGFTDLTSAVLGAAGAYLFLWSVYWGFKLLTGKEGMGYGDFKLFAAIGAWLGWTALPAVILIAATAGLAYSLVTMLRGRWQRDQHVPFGPFLALAGWTMLIFRDQAETVFPLI